MQYFWKALPIEKNVRAAAAFLLVLILVGGRDVGVAGPPLITDDPETPGQGGWEINVSHNIEHSKDAFLMESPLFDINYGLLENDQWKVECPVLYLDSAEHGAHWAMGDLLLGWKYRFLEEEHHGVMASVYPQLSTPTGIANLGLGSGHAEALLPFQVGKHFSDDKVFIYGEIGYNVVFGQPESNRWKYGLAAQWQAAEKLEWMAEVGGFAFPQDGEVDDVFFNLGFKRPITHNVSLIASCGRSFRSRDRGTPDLLTYVGLQITRDGRAHEEE